MSDEYESEDLSELLESIGVSGALPGASPAVSGSKPNDDYIKDQFKLGRALTGTPVETMKAFDDARDAKKAAVQKRIETLNLATQRLMASKDGNINLPLLAAAGALLGPTKTGRFGESLGKAFESSIGPLANQRQQERSDTKQLTEIDMLRAGAEEALAGIDFDILGKKMDYGQKALGNAVTAQTRRDVAETNATGRRDALAARTAAAGRPQIRVLQGVGLVKFNPVDSTHEVLIASPDPKKDPKVRAAYMRLVDGTTKGYRFESPDAKLAYDTEMVDSLINTGAPFATATIESDLINRKVPRVPAAPTPGTPAPSASVASAVPEEAEAAPGAVSSPTVPGARPQPARIDPAAEAGRKKEAEVEAAKSVAEAVAAREASEAAGNSLATIDTLRAIRAPTGRLAPAKEFIGSWMDALGFDKSDANRKRVADARDLTTFNAIATDVILNKQILQKGTQTEGDAQRMKETFANIKNPMAANDLIMRYTEATSRRMMEQSEFMEKYKAEHKTYSGAKGAWLKHIETTPLVKRVDGQLRFFNEFRRKARADNEGLEDLDNLILQDWRSIK